MLIGYEFEFLTSEGVRPLSQEKFLAFHALLANKGWQPKYDAGTKKLVGSIKNDFFVTTDDSVCITEINTPPKETIQECDLQIRALLKNLQTDFQNIGCTFLFTNTFPGSFEDSDCQGGIQCTHNICCNKSHIKYLNPQLFGSRHFHLFYIAANHIWLDVEPSQIVIALDVFNRMSGVFSGLFGNGPIANQKSMRVIEGRDILWRHMLRNSQYPYEEENFGMFSTPIKSVIQYFDLIMNTPFYYEMRNGKSFSLRDKKKTYKDFFFGKETEAQWFDLKPFKVKPEKDDFLELQRVIFPNIRLKYFLKEEITLDDLLAAYQKREDQALLHCFKKTCLEVRSIGVQPQSDISAGSAFSLGILMNLEEAKRLLDTKRYASWLKYYHDSVKKGLLNPELVDGFLKIAEQGLKNRKKGEEQFLQPLFTRVKKGMNPGQELLKIFEKDGINGIFEACKYK